MSEINTSSDHVDNEPSSIVLDNLACKYLRTAAKWARFLSVLGFVFSFLMFVGGFFYVDYQNFILSLQGVDAPMQLGGIRFLSTFIFGIVAILHFIPAYYLYRFSTGVLNSLANGNSSLMCNALRYLKSHYTYIGSIYAVFLCAYLILAVMMAIIYFSYKYLYL